MSPAKTPRYRKGDRVESLRWPGTHGTGARREGEWLDVRWDGTTFTEADAHTSEVTPSSRPPHRAPAPATRSCAAAEHA